MKGKIINFFSDKKFYKILFVLALPIMIQNLLMSSLSMADTIMVGALGDIAVAAVGIGNQVNFLVQLFMFGIAEGSCVFISQFWGKRDKNNIKKTVGLSLVSSIIIGGIGTIIVLCSSSFIARVFTDDVMVINQVVSYLKITAPSYIVNAITIGLAFSLRSIEDSKTPMVVSAIGVGANVFLNYCLIFGNFGMSALGVEGAAIATVIARCIEAMLLVLIARKNSVLKGKISEFFAFNLEFSKNVYKTIIPVLLNEICWGIGNFLYSIAYGQISVEAIASVQICTNIQNVFMVLGMSMSSAALVMIGNKIGQDKKDVAKDYGEKFVFLSFLTGLIVGLGLILSSKSIVNLFNVSNEVKMYSVIILNIFSVLAPIRMMNLVIIVGVLRGGGDAGYALKAEAIPMWLIGVPLAFIGAIFLKLDIQYVVILVSLEEIIKLILIMRRLKGDKWIKSVIKNIDL